MFIERSQGSGYDRSGQQVSGQARFLILVTEEGRSCTPDTLRAIVRKVSLRQCGHFMMGSARAFGERIAISGSYGADGLPQNVSSKVYAKAIPVPPELYEAWNKGGGWNGVGIEASAMREWALANLNALESRPAKKVKPPLKYPKRIRMSATLAQRVRNTQADIRHIYIDAMREGRPLTIASNEARERIDMGTWPSTVKERLTGESHALWQYTVQAFSHWQLYLDGQPTDSDAISAARQAGDEDVWHRVHGRAEWCNLLPNHVPFYENENPRPTYEGAPYPLARRG